MTRLCRTTVATCAMLAIATTLSAQALIITPSTKTLQIGETVTLTASKPGVTWDSSDDSIATVVRSGDRGIVTAQGTGVATISGKYRNQRGTATITVVAASVPTPPLVVACPSNVSATSSTGSPVAVTYTATASGGVLPITIVGTPASGSLFPVGITAVQVTATDSAKTTSTCAFNVSVVYSTVDPTWVQIATNASIQSAINANPGATTFLIKTGVHTISSAITPKTGNTFIGEAGAIIDGTGWVTSDDTQGAFRSWNQDIDNVTISRLIIRNMPQSCISTNAPQAMGWTIDNNDLSACRVGIKVGNNFVVRNNKIHDTTIGGYQAYIASGVLFENNEIYSNPGEQKIVGCTNITFRNNFVHHNVADGIWYDTANTGSLIEGNRVEDNGRQGIHYEISGQGIIRNNQVARSGEAGITLVMSKDVELYGNTLTDNFRGIQYYLKCAIAGQGPGGGSTFTYDLTNLNSHDNNILVGTRSGSWASSLGWNSNEAECTAAFVAPYLSGAKNLVFQHNNYSAPNLTARWWMWGQLAFKSWSEWQALGRDTTGTFQLR